MYKLLVSKCRLVDYKTLSNIWVDVDGGLKINCRNRLEYSIFSNPKVRGGCRKSVDEKRQIIYLIHECCTVWALPGEKYLKKFPDDSVCSSLWKFYKLIGYNHRTRRYI